MLMEHNMSSDTDSIVPDMSYRKVEACCTTRVPELVYPPRANGSNGPPVVAG